MKQPDPKRHLYISIAKSMVRITAGIVLMGGWVFTAGGLLIIAEFLGIGEELV